MNSAPGGLDPLTLTVLWGRLVSICDEMGRSLIRTAYSEGVREGEDLSAGLFDSGGELVAQADYAPGHLGAMPEVIRNFLHRFPAETLRPLDALVLNDLYMNSGHFNDIYMCMPVFSDDQLVGFVANSAHHVDVGGMAPGSQAVEGVLDFYQEGLRLLPTKLYERGVANEGVLDVIAANVRTPDLCIGDLAAQYSALRVGAARLQETVKERTWTVVRQGMQQILEQSEAAARDAIQVVPDGEYSAEDFLDDFGPHTEPIRVHVRVEVRGDTVVIDLSESSDQTQSGFNSPINFTRAQCYFTVKSFAYPDLPQNAGGIRPITVQARPGSFFNPRPPAAAGGRAIIGTRLFEVVQAALAKAAAERAVARNSQWASLTIGGADATGRAFVYWDVIIGGLGARAARDGSNSLALPFNFNNIPVEVHEARYPIRVERIELITDSGGPGQFRGGLGLRKDIRVLVDGARVATLTDRHVFVPGGLSEGRPGSPGAVMLNSAAGERLLHSKGTASIRSGDVVTCLISGAGGYGNPLDRDPDAVARDVVAGFVSRERADSDYGVVLAPDGLSADLERTTELRIGRRLASATD